MKEPGEEDDGGEALEEDGEEVECAALEGGAVGGEKSRTPPPRPERGEQHLLYIPWLSTYSSTIHPTYVAAVDGRPVKIIQSMTSKRTHGAATCDNRFPVFAPQAPRNNCAARDNYSRHYERTALLVIRRCEECFDDINSLACPSISRIRQR